MPIIYKVNAELPLPSAVELYRASTLAERRPVDDEACMAQMLSEANLVVTAWQGELLAGLARSFTDYCYCCYVTDLVVRVTHKGWGIPRELILQTRAALGPKAVLYLLAASSGEDYYRDLGVEKYNAAWVVRGGRQA